MLNTCWGETVKYAISKLYKQKHGQRKYFLTVFFVKANGYLSFRL